jgi:hypothetical protein
MRRKISAAALLVFAAALSLLTPALAAGGEAPAASVAPTTSITVTLHASDPSLGTNLVFVAEGYRAHEQARFLHDANAMVERLDRSFAAEPMRHARIFNYSFVFTASSVPASAREKPAASALRARVEDEQVFVDEDRLDAAARLAGRGDVAIALVQFRGREGESVRATARVPRFVGETYVRGSIAIPSVDPDDFLHELGHALWSLGDEYSESSDPLTAELRAAVAERPNVTTDPSGARWRALALAHPFEGALRLRKGVFRPERDCVMRDFAAPGFCSVCRAILEGAFDRDPADPSSLAVAQGPLRGDLLVAGVPVEVSWRQGERAPVSFAVAVVRISRTRDEVASRVLEGQVTRTVLDPLEPGRYELLLQARNTAPHRGRWVSVGFTVVSGTAVSGN